MTKIITPGAIAVKALSIAQGFADVHTQEEGGENRGKQVEAFLHAVGLGPGAPWCAAFVRHCLEKSAGFLGKTIPAGFPDSGYCPDFKNWGKGNGLWIPVAEAAGVVKPGDMVLFYFSAKARVAHTGIVAEVHDWGVYTVEGNTGPEHGEVNREGDGVYRKKRDWSELGTGGGFVRLGF